MCQDSFSLPGVYSLSVHIIIMLQINIPHSLFGHPRMVHYSITQRPLAATLPPGLNISIFYRPCKKGNDLNAGYIQWEKDFYHSIVVSNDGVFGKVCYQYYLLFARVSLTEIKNYVS